MDLVHALAAWLHSIATVILLGYYTVMALVVVPILRGTLNGPALGRVVPEIERRALPLVLGAVGIFALTGLYLMLSDQRYLGLGQVFGNTWSTLIVVKHLLVVGLIGIGVYIDLMVVRDIAMPVDEALRAAAMRRLARSITAIVVLGALVLLLTTAAQAS